MGWDGPLTHRQYLAMIEWDIEDMNRPGKHEYYLMQIACEARRVLSSKPNSVKLDQFKLSFKHKTTDPSAQYAKNITNLAKSAWTMRVGGKVIQENPEPIELDPLGLGIQI